MSEGVISREMYFTARDALQALVEQRERLFREGLDLAGLRAWLEAGVADRWCELEAVIQRARAVDLALSMWWEKEWREARTQRIRAEQAQRDRERAAQRQAARQPEQPAATAQTPAPATTRRPPGPPSAPGPRKKKPDGPPAAAAQRGPGPRRFEPSGPVWKA